VLSKEVALTAPLVVLLYDRVFLSASWRDAVRARCALYMGLFACWVFVLPRAAAVMHFTPSSGASVGFAVPGITALEYAQSQPGVILHYLRLVFWPVGLCLDYGWPVARGFDDVILPAVALVLLLVLMLWALVRRPGLGFCGLCFFLVLAPTSSIVPLSDLAFEHRMYLPLAPVILLAVLGADSLWRGVSTRLFPDEGMRRLAGLSLLIAVVGVMVVLTMLRNDDYCTKIGMWTDVVTKRPNNARGQQNLASELVSEGSVGEGIVHYLESIKLKPNSSPTHCNLGNALLRLGKQSAAIAEFREAIRIDPNNSEARCYLGAELVRLGRLSDAVDQFREAIRTSPDFAQAHYNLGIALNRQQNRQEAVVHFNEALRINSDFPIGHFYLANVLVEMGRVEEAILHYREAVRLKPDYGQAHGNLGGALLRQGKLAEAVEHFRQCLRQYPRLAPMHNNLGQALLLLGKWEEAAHSCARAAALEPGTSLYHRNRGFALSKQGRLNAAKEEYHKSLKLAPNWPRECLSEAWTLATHPDHKRRNGKLAIFTAEQVLHALRDELPEALDTVAAAHAENGQLEQAKVTARRALAVARAVGNKRLAAEIAGRLALYEKGQPFRTTRPRWSGM
jgi:tetratricopeptide (TPR) repeat protein